MIITQSFEGNMKCLNVPSAKMDTELYNNVPDEEYLVLRAKNALKTDPTAAKAWMITAITLYPSNFNVQFEAYRIEKEAGNVKDAAKSFSLLLNNFQQEQELWKEVQKVTVALRSENENTETESQFLCEMFKHIPLAVQRQLLLVTADHCEDTMEHCRLLLLLVKKFPAAVSSHGPRLVDTLLSAEKHSHSSNQPVNCYRRLLVTEVLPLLANTAITIPPKLLRRLMDKSIEFYLYSLMMNKSTPMLAQETKDHNNECWTKLFKILDCIGMHMRWNTYLTKMGKSWNKEAYWQKLLSYLQSQTFPNGGDPAYVRDALYGLTILFLNCWHDYKQSLAPEPPSGQIKINLLLIEAFVDVSLPAPIMETKSKRRRSDADPSTPSLTTDKPGTIQIINNFIIACNCWDLLHSSDALHKEFLKLSSYLKLDSIIGDFVLDYAIYKGVYEDAMVRLQPIPEPSQALVRNIRLMCVYYCKKNYTACFEHLLLVISSLSGAPLGKLSTLLAVGGTARHLHYLPLTQNSVLQYCVRILVNLIREHLGRVAAGPSTYNELGLGVLLTLVQLDWPQQEDLLPPIMDQIRQRNSFQYPLFQAYVINVDILEELMYLWTDHGGRATLDIFSSSQNQVGQRRIGTRGADKGVKEDFKQAMRRQVARSNEPMDKLIVQFITQERIHILQTLMS